MIYYILKNNIEIQYLVKLQIMKGYAYRFYDIAYRYYA